MPAVLVQFLIQVDARVFPRQQLLQLSNGSALDGLARHRASENIMRLVLGIYRQLEIELIEDMNVGKNPRFLMLDDLLSLDVELVAFVFQYVGDQTDAVRENMDVDVRPLADVPGHNAADEAGAKRPQQPHESQRLQAHGPKVLRAAIAFVDAGKMLNLVADFCVGGEVLGF